MARWPARPATRWLAASSCYCFVCAFASRRTLWRTAQALTRPARACDSATPGEQGGPLPDTQAALLRQHALLTAPRLLDACALFGPDNSELTSRLVQNALTLAPWLLEEVAAAGAAAGASVAEVLERCDAALTPGASGGSTRADELADGVAYFVDVGATLAAFARAAPQAAAAMLAGEGASLLPALAALHDRVCPKLARAVPLLASAAGRGQAAARDAFAALLHAAYLSPCGGGEAARTSQREGLLLVVHACGAAEESPGGRGLLRDLGAASSFRAALAEADLALDSEQRALVRAAFGVAEGASAAEPSQAAASVDPLAASRIAAVRDVLPHLGDGFVMACLAALGNEPERVVAAVLEVALPGSLSSMDQAMSLEQFTAPQRARQLPPPKAPPPPTPQPRPAAPAPNLQVLPKKGERNRWERDEGVQLLNKRDANAASAALARAAVFEEEEAMAEKEAAGFDAYDDEYDDTYDDLAVHVSEAATDADGDGDAEAAATQPVARPVSRPSPASAPAPRPRAIPAAGGRQSKFWLLDGKVYSYAKAGAEAVTAGSAEEAARLATARAAEAASLIHGLGAGGNRGPPAGGGGGGASSSEDEDGGEAGGATGGGAGRGRLGPPDGARARARKEHNKGAVGNHHRKDRAANKQRALLGPT